MERKIRFPTKGSRMLRRTFPSLLLLALAVPVGAQNVVLDEGTFRLLNGRRDVGTETFTIRRIGQGADAHVIANAVLELDLPIGHQQVKPLLQTGTDLGVTAYQVGVSGANPVDVRVELNGRRFLTTTRTPAGEQEREFRAAPGSVLLEEGVAHQYWFLSKLAEGTHVSVLVPRSGTQYDVAVRSVRPESIRIAGATVDARHVTIEVDGKMHEVWYDADGRVLKVNVPSTGFAAERTSR